MSAPQYHTLAAVYDWLVPDALLEPEGAVAAFGEAVDILRPGDRVLDCAAGTGQLAVGLALRGHRMVASDASAAMVARTRALAARHAVDVHAVVCTWEKLPIVVGGPFDAVFCVGNSLAHAVGQGGRRRALAALRAVLRVGGRVTVTSRNWERLRDRPPGLEVDPGLTHRAGRQGLVIHAWHVPERWEDPHHVDIAVAVLGPHGRVETTAERLAFWPFTHDTLSEDLRVSGLTPVSSTYAPDTDRYLVTARR